LEFIIITIIITMADIMAGIMEAEIPL
jgi:hypothetical protein